MTFVCLTLTDNALIIHHIIFISKLFQLIEHIRIRIINLPQKRSELPLCGFDTLNPIHSQRLCIHMYDLVSRHCICKDTAVFYIKQFFIINILTQFFFAQRIIQFCKTSLRLFFFFNTHCLRNILMYSSDSHIFCHRCVSRTTATYKPLSGYRMNITINDFRPCLCKLIRILLKQLHVFRMYTQTVKYKSLFRCDISVDSKQFIHHFIRIKSRWLSFFHFHTPHSHLGCTQNFFCIDLFPLLHKQPSHIYFPTHFFRICAITLNSIFISTGLETCAFMPLSRAFCLSSSNALAVMATIGMSARASSR